MIALAWREARRGYATGGGWLTVGFFLLVTILFPFAIGPDGALLARVGGGVVWAAALLAALMPVERLVAPDLDSGTIDQLAVRGIAPVQVAAAKIAGHWLAFAPPLMLAAIPAAGLLSLPAATLLRVEAGLALGTPGLAALAVATGALVGGTRGAGAVAGLAMLPLAVPLLIFGAGTLDDVGAGGAFRLLAATSLVMLAGAPFVAGAAIRMALE